MSSLKNKAVMFAVAAGLALAGAAGARAEDAGASYIESAQTGQVTDATLQKFVKAETAVKQIEAQFDAQAGAAGSGEALANLQQQTSLQIAEAIEQNGLNVNEYQAIASALKTDTQLQARYQGLAR